MKKTKIKLDDIERRILVKLLYEKRNELICEGFKELDAFLGSLPLDDNNAVWNLCCQLCTAYAHKAFIDGHQYGAHLMQNLK